MTSPVFAEHENSQLSPFPAAQQELLLLETLQILLDGASRCLATGDALPLMEMSRQITATAQQVQAFASQLSGSVAGADAQRRRKLLAELAQQRAFCRAMLRRWRRSIVLRRHLLGVEGGPPSYCDAWPRETI